MEYEIIATLGPNSAEAKFWMALHAAGASGFRLNTSHLELDELHTWLEKLDKFRSQVDPSLKVILDLQGSKWRLGHFPVFTLQPGQTIEVVYGEVPEVSGVLPVPHPDFFAAAASSSGIILINDGAICLEIERLGARALSAQVLRGGEFVPRRGITYTAYGHRLEHLSEKDRLIWEQTWGREGIQYAISYVKDALEMERYRALFGEAAHLIAKLERQPAVSQAREIARFANAIWLCRGDLGAELGLPGMAAAVADFSYQVHNLPVPAFLAGQVFEHMKANPTPTRSEVCCLYEALQKGYLGVVLSDETAIGNYPLESCQAAAMFLNLE